MDAVVATPAESARVLMVPVAPPVLFQLDCGTEPATVPLAICWLAWPAIDSVKLTPMVAAELTPVAAATAAKIVILIFIFNVFGTGSESMRILTKGAFNKIPLSVKIYFIPPWRKISPLNELYRAACRVKNPVDSTYPVTIHRILFSAPYLPPSCPKRSTLGSMTLPISCPKGWPLMVKTPVTELKINSVPSARSVINTIVGPLLSEPTAAKE